MVHPAAPTPPNDGVSLTEPRRTALTHLLVLAHNTPVHPHPHSHTHPELVRHPSRCHQWSAELSSLLTGFGFLCTPCRKLTHTQWPPPALRSVASQTATQWPKEVAAGRQLDDHTAKVMKLDINAAEIVQKQLKVTLTFAACQEGWGLSQLRSYLLCY